MTSTDKTWRELGVELLGLTTLMFAVEAGSWWLAHQFAWWTYALATGGGYIGWSFLKGFARAIAKDVRASRRRRRSVAP